MIIPEPAILDVLALAVPQFAATILTIKGVASIICNNLPTQDWGKTGQILEWLASNNKEAKKTGNYNADRVVDAIKPLNKNVISRILNKLS